MLDIEYRRERGEKGFAVKDIRKRHGGRGGRRGKD
jgi:hypothetical protein